MQRLGSFAEEIAETRATGRPTERLGHQLLAFCRTIASDRQMGLLGNDLDEAVANAVFRCLRSVRNVPIDKAEAYFTSVAINELRRAVKKEATKRRRNEEIERDIRPDRSYSRKGPR